MKLHTCPSCGFFVFEEPVGSYDICPICSWEDDLVQFQNPFLTSGSNKESLYNYQQKWIKHIPLDVSERIGGIKKIKYHRDPKWRPIKINH